MDGGRVGGREGAYRACLAENLWVLKHHMTTHPPSVTERGSEERKRQREDKSEWVEGGDVTALLSSPVHHSDRHREEAGANKA